MPSHDFLDAYVIHHRPYRETSVIADFFSQSQGRISAVVRGVRKAKSDKKSLIQSFQPLIIQLAGKSELKTLSHVESTDVRAPLHGDTLYCGLYMNEVLMRALPSGLAVEPLFAVYEQCLQALPANTGQDIVLRHFEFALLSELGVMPDLSFDANTEQPIDPTQAYYFDPEHGFSHVNKGGQAHLGQTIQDMVQQNWNAQSRLLAKQICRLLLKPILGNKPLNSRALFKKH